MILLVLCVVTFCDALVSSSFGRPIRKSTFLLGKKRGNLRDLASMAEEDGMTRRKAPRKTVKKKKKSSNAAGGVSPLLAEWAAQDETTTATEEEATAEEAVVDVMAVAPDEYVPFERAPKKGSNKNRRARQTEREQRDKRFDKAIKSIVEELNDTIAEGSNNLDDILRVIQKLLKQETELPRLRQLSASASSKSFRLAWVGSDDAICHIGTGLHKIALARLQEVFLTLPGRNRWLLYEVISVLGPFPNVRNTLDAKSSIANYNDSSNSLRWRIDIESMIDGTGKELLAGKAENERKVDLQVVFADPNVIVAVVPLDDKAPRQDPLEDKGKHVLVFVAEDDLDNKLDQLRVS